MRRKETGRKPMDRSMNKLILALFILSSSLFVCAEEAKQGGLRSTIEVMHTLTDFNKSTWQCLIDGDPFKEWEKFRTAIEKELPSGSACVLSRMSNSIDPK